MSIVLKYGSLNFLEPSGPVQACNGIASLCRFKSSFPDIPDHLLCSAGICVLWSISIYQSTRRNNPEDLNLHRNRFDTLKFRNTVFRPDVNHQIPTSTQIAILSESGRAETRTKHHRQIGIWVSLFLFSPVEGRQISVSFISLHLIPGVVLLVISASKWETDEDTCRPRNFKTASRGFLWRMGPIINPPFTTRCP